MGKIITSPDINELISDQLTLFDGSDGLVKGFATCLAKVVELQAQKLLIDTPAQVEEAALPLPPEEC